MSRKIIFLIVGIICVGLGISLFFILRHHHKSSTSSSSSSKHYEWVTTSDPSGECSMPCGGGFQYLKVFCASSNAPTVPINDSYCIDNVGTKPATKIPCNTDPCEWQIGSWSPCSESCGYDGTQTRTVTCPVPPCSSPQPSTSQSCPNTFCEWTASDWSPAGCATCGKGTQTRTVSCPRKPTNCDSTKQPSISQECTSPNNCEWEQGGRYYPYPPFDMTVLNSWVSNKTSFKLLERNNQSRGLKFNNPNIVDDSVTNATSFIFTSAEPLVSSGFAPQPQIPVIKQSNGYLLSLRTDVPIAGAIYYNYDSTINDIAVFVFDIGLGKSFSGSFD